MLHERVDVVEPVDGGLHHQRLLEVDRGAAAGDDSPEGGEAHGGFEQDLALLVVWVATGLRLDPESTARVLASRPMRLIALSPVHVAPLVWRRDARSWILTVVCKASFDLLPGEMRLSAQQDVINERDQRWEDDGARSVHTPDDLAPFKTRADVTLVGTAFAPGGVPVRSLVVRLACAGIDKSIAVHGDRARSSEPAPWKRMALRYERAAGGPGTANPVGVADRLPNLEPARRGEGPVPPIGFGPIAADWPERQQKLGRAGWSPSEPFPEDLDASYFNVAPADQQVPALRHDQALHLENLHPEHARLVTRLPGLRPQAFVERAGAQPHEIEMHADGLWIDTDRGRCAVTWRAQVSLAQPDEPGRVLVAMVGARQQLTWNDALRLDEALRGSPVYEGAATPPPEAPRSRPELPQIGMEEEDDRLHTTVAMKLPAPVPGTPPAPVPPRPPPPKRTTTLAGPPPSHRAQLPTMEVPGPGEATSTNLFMVGEHTPIFDALPAWLAPSSQRGPAVPGVAPAPPLPLPPTPPAMSAPPPVIVEPLPAPAPEPRSPWSTAGAAVGTGTAPAVALPAITPLVEAARPMAIAAARAPGVEEVIDLVWFDPEAVPRIRARWPAIIDALEFEPLDPRHDLPVDDPQGSRDRHHVFGVLTRADATDARGVPREVLEAVGDRGRFTPPLVVIGGELRFPFDEIEMLKTAAAAAKPLAKDDKRLTDLLEMLGELLETPLLQGSPSAVESLLRDLQAAVQQSKRALPVKYLDAHLERVLLEQRRYQRRTVFGGPCLRALLTPGALPAYLPATLAERLPLVTQLKARLIAEVNPNQDQYESHPHALRVVALGRVMSLEGARRG